MSISRKLLIPTFIFVAIVMLALIVLGTLDATRYLEEQEDETLQGLVQVFSNRINSLEQFAVALATEVGNNPEVQKAFAEGDRERLIELTHPAYMELDSRFDVPQHQFHLPPATSFLRVHQLDRFGDDLSDFRFTVLEANQTQRPVSGIEVGRAGVGVRGVVPVNYEGEHIGTVEFGLNVDQTLLNQLKQGIGSDWQIHLRRELLDIATFESAEGLVGPTPDLVLQGTTLEQPLFVESTAYQQALNGSFSISRLSADDRDFAVISAPLYDFSGEIIGVVEAISDRTDVLAEQARSRSLAIFASIVVLLLGGIGLSVIAVRTLHPIGELTNAATAIAQGNLQQPVPVFKTKDELESLSLAVNNMTEQLRSSLGEMEQRVAERTQRLELLALLAERFSAILQIDQLFKEIVNQIKDSFGYYHAHIYRLDETNKTLGVAAGTGRAGEEMLAQGHSIAFNAPTSLVARAARERQVIRVDDVQQAPDWLPNPLLPKTRSEMAVPIVLEGDIVGVLDVQSDKIAGLDEGDAALLRSVANQVAVAIRNAQQFEQVQAALAEARAVQKQYLEQAWSRDLVTRGHVRRVQFSLGESTTLDEAVIAQAKQQVKADQTLSLVSLDPGDANPENIDLTESKATSHAMVAPLKLRGVILGSLQFHGVDPDRQWTDSEMRLINTIIDQVVQAAENIRLLNETQERARREQLISQISDKLQRAPDFETLLKTGVEELARVLGPTRTFVKLGSETELLQTATSQPAPSESTEVSGKTTSSSAPVDSPATIVTNNQPTTNGRGDKYE